LINNYSILYLTFLFILLRDEEGKIEKISSGILPKVFTTYTFATMDGGYAIAYVLNKTHSVITFSDSVDPMWQCHIQFLRPRSNILTDPILIYQTNLRLQSIQIQSCHVLYDR